MAMVTSISNAGRLKPDIKLQQALKEFMDILTKEQRMDETSRPKPRDVMILSCEVNRIVSFDVTYFTNPTP